MDSFEAEMMRMLEAERASSHERAMLLELMQHDMSNLVSRVTLSVAAMSIAVGEDDKARWLAEVRSGLSRAREMLHGIRTITAPEMAPGDIQDGDFSAFAGDMVRRVTNSKPGTTVRVESEGDARTTFSPLLMRQALSNLIEHAVSCSEGTWVRVRIKTPRNGRCQVAIANGRPHAATFGSGTGGCGVSSAAKECSLAVHIARVCLQRQGIRLRRRSSRLLAVLAFSLPVCAPAPEIIPLGYDRDSVRRAS